MVIVRAKIMLDNLPIWCHFLWISDETSKTGCCDKLL